MRDGLVELLRGAGIEVVTDAEEDQRVLDAVNGRVQAMGTTTRRRPKQIGEHFEGRELPADTRAIVDVFSNKTSETRLEFEDVKGKTRKVVFRQGQDQKAGVKHSVFRHYETRENYYMAEEIPMIPGVIRNGQRNQNGNRVSYEYEKGGVVYTVTTQLKSTGEKVFTNFYTNRKPTAGNNGTSNTAQQHAPQQSDSGAKLQKDGDSASDGGEKVSSDVLFDGAKKKFGVTHDIREAGYVLPDGSMLDFSGRRGRERLQREQEREVAKARGICIRRACSWPIQQTHCKDTT